jgi:hypothetical protein
MSSFRQIEANRRNARLSTGPVTEGGKRKSRQNALRHGLTVETVIDALEDAEDYAAFEMAVTADYDAQRSVSTAASRGKDEGCVEPGLPRRDASPFRSAAHSRRVLQDMHPCRHDAPVSTE